MFLLSSEILREQIIDSSIKFLQENTSKTNIDIQVSVNQKAIIKDSTINCDGNIILGNVAKVQTEVFNTMTNVEKTNFETFLKNEMAGMISNSVEQANKDLNLLQANVSVQDNKTSDNLMADLSTLISSKTQQLFNAEITKTINQEIVVEESDLTCGGDFIAVNDVDLRNTMINVMEDTAITDILKTIETEMEVEVENVTTQTNEGINILDFFLMPIIICVCVAVVILALLLLGPRIFGKLNPMSLFTKKSRVSPGHGTRISPAMATPIDTITLKIAD